MSYILDALKRAEQQRGAPRRGAASLPRAIATDLEARARWPWIVGGGVSLAAVAALIALWPARDASSPVATPPATVAAPPPAVVSAPPRPEIARPRAEPASAAPPVLPERMVSAPAAPRVSERRPPASRPEPVVDRPSPSAGARRGAAARSAPPPAVDERSAASRVAPAPRPSATPRVEERAPAPPAAEVARATPPRAVSPEPAPPAAPAAPSGDLKARAARLSIQVLSWAPERKDRFVFLNGRKYGEGQMVEDKFLVEQITEDSVVLSAQGERVTLKGR
jgi:hypothetical protein